MKEQLLVHAAEAFGRYGFERTRLEDIAAEANITRASLLYHYPSKAEIFEVALERAFEELDATIEGAILREGDYEARIENVVSALLEFDRKHRSFVSLVTRCLVGNEDAIARRVVHRLFIPTVDRLELVVRSAAEERLPPEFPVRAAILQLISAHLLRSSSGLLGKAIWTGDAHTLTLAKTLLCPPGVPHGRHPDSSRRFP